VKVPGTGVLASRRAIEQTLRIKGLLHCEAGCEVNANGLERSSGLPTAVQTVFSRGGLGSWRIEFSSCAAIKL